MNAPQALPRARSPTCTLTHVHAHTRARSRSRNDILTVWEQAGPQQAARWREHTSQLPEAGTCCMLLHAGIAHSGCFNELVTLPSGYREYERPTGGGGGSVCVSLPEDDIWAVLIWPHERVKRRVWFIILC